MTGSNNFLVPGRLGEDQNLILTVFSIKDDSNDSVNDSNPFDDAFEVFDSDDDSEFSNSNDSYEFADPDENSEFSKKDLHLISDTDRCVDRLKSRIQTTILNLLIRTTLMNSLILIVPVTRLPALATILYSLNLVQFLGI